MLCALCKQNEIKKMAMRNNHICQDCYTYKTVSKLDVEREFLDRDKLTKYYYKNSVFYSKEEFQKMEKNTDKDIIQNQTSEKFFGDSSDTRKFVIDLIVQTFDLYKTKVAKDENVERFIRIGLIPCETDKEFFDTIIKLYQ